MNDIRKVAQFKCKSKKETTRIKIFSRAPISRPYEYDRHAVQTGRARFAILLILRGKRAHPVCMEAALIFIYLHICL